MYTVSLASSPGAIPSARCSVSKLPTHCKQLGAAVSGPSQRPQGGHSDSMRRCAVTCDSSRPEPL